MAESRRGEPEQEDPATIDRISSLPDSVLCHILSFLPTKASVATSTLSHRWRRLWEHLQVFDFDDCRDDHYYEPDLFKRFAVLVNGVLTLRTARDIRKFRLRCCYAVTDFFNTNSVAMWVRTAIGPHLEELDLCLYSGWDFPLPRSVFTCEALLSLRLVGDILVKVEQPLSSVRLPSLKILKLEDVEVDSIHTLLSACPALETLDLFFEVARRAPKIRVPSSSLKSLKFADKTGFELEELEIDAPSLEYLNITLTTWCSRFSVSNLQNEVEAHLDFCEVDEHVDFVLMLLRALSRTKFLALRRSTIKCLLLAPILDLPEFVYLLRVQLSLPNFNSSFLVDVLQKCHILQVLTIWNKKEPSPLGSWTQPTSVPNCLVSHLTMIKFRGYQGFADEKAFTAYILQRALVLKTMTIQTDSSLDIEEKHDILKELSVMPRGSNMCQLNFD